MTLNLTADPERVKHLLITARDELKTRGWCQFSYGSSSDGPKCTVGAIAWAECGEAEYRGDVSPAQIGAEVVLGTVIGSMFIATWNDDPDRTAAQVIAAFDAGIALVDAEIARRASVARVQEIAHLAGIETQVNA